MSEVFMIYEFAEGTEFFFIEILLLQQIEWFLFIFHNLKYVPILNDLTLLKIGIGEDLIDFPTWSNVDLESHVILTMGESANILITADRDSVFIIQVIQLESCR